MNLMKRKMMKRLSVPAALCMLAMLLFAAVPARAAQMTPPTGDDSNIGLWIGVMAAAVAGIVLILVLHKKNKE